MFGTLYSGYDKVSSYNYVVKVESTKFWSPTHPYLRDICHFVRPLPLEASVNMRGPEMSLTDCSAASLRAYLICTCIEVDPHDGPSFLPAHRKRQRRFSNVQRIDIQPPQALADSISLSFYMAKASDAHSAPTTSQTPSTTRSLCLTEMLKNSWYSSDSVLSVVFSGAYEVPWYDFDFLSRPFYPIDAEDEP
ncbi:hypothetical protein ACRALDRAFT_209521 [Sodiomyces alcalophilus JCM 7366]|uniref:uncharacterized protein n=1 Tax=Sodiomyces alcalophilus JCM 7366 TaxID=591952 RepID=UPI0039B42E75